MTHASAAEVFSPRGKQKMVYSKHDSINTVALGRCFTPTSRDDQILLVTSKHYQSSPDLSRSSHNQTPENGRPQRYGSRCQSPNNRQILGYSAYGRGLGGPGLSQSPKRAGSADVWEEAQSRWTGQGADRLPLPAAATTTRHSPSGQSLRSQDSGFSDSGDGAAVAGLPTLDISSSYAAQQADRRSSSCDRGACSSSGLIGTCDKRTAGCVTADSHNRTEREQHGYVYNLYYFSNISTCILQHFSTIQSRYL
jgi:hypothetical protein